MKLAIMFIIIAFVLYTISIWSSRIKKNLSYWIILIFSLAFLSDLAGTGIMSALAETHRLNFHRLCGFSALLIMLLHLLWAWYSIFNHKTRNYFHKYSLLAWLVWLTAFISGIPK